jgi:arylsulfatase A-like enzyme
MPTDPVAAPARDTRPNIVLILADDMGYSDIGCYGSEIRTPALDRLAANGVRFTQFYNCARCCPTRASLLTGLYPHQAGVGHMVADLGTPAYQGYLRDDCVTIAEALGAAGYRTMMSGKWHVGGPYVLGTEWRPGAPGAPLPVQRGFDEHYGTLAGAGSYFCPHALIEDDTFVEVPDDGYYYTDAISDRAADMIGRAAGGEPFFLYVAYTAPHWPLHAWEEDISRYRGCYRGGWDALRTARHETLKASGILDARWPISPRDADAPPWEEVSEQDWEDARMAVYAAQVDRMDQGIGRIMDRLRAEGLEENTLVFFLSDNGGCAELLREDGSRGSVLGETRDGRPVRLGNRRDLMPGGADTFMSYDTPWANASNTPFRLFKHWVHEGGIATPLIAHWPQGFAGGRIVHAPGHVIDIMATCLEAAGAGYPESYGERQITPLEGESLLAACRGADWSRERPIFWEHEGNRAIRTAEWKAVSKYPGEWELYNMIEDRTELVDLAGRDRPRRDAMVRAYEEWAERVEAISWDVQLARMRELRRRH